MKAVVGYIIIGILIAVLLFIFIYKWENTVEPMGSGQSLGVSLGNMGLPTRKKRS